MTQLNVQAGTLERMADQYKDLAARASMIGPRVADEVQRVVATHGPMGYPVAVGILRGMVPADQAATAKAADFGKHAERFTEHAAAYTAADRAGAARMNSIGFPNTPDAYKDPSPPPPGQANPFICYIGTEDGDVKRICPPDTKQVSYFDKAGRYVIKDLKTEETEIRPLGPSEGNPTACWLPSADANRSICGPGTTSWTYPRGGNIVTEEIGPDGKHRIAFNTPPGPLVP
ncbi:type VII secretion target (plasmid) [Mycolicibacterium aubagnense]|uniref:type VII secretion target n=1 Tax=Mycolicibacterium aubagnense TaxID=319707 RepID=UPI00244D999E|nr:type VII secretion target [Mycolicibacterium aubagnense]WGI35971.1 type VII secretion target [Mycolicibacterium aubagnense]